MAVGQDFCMAQLTAEGAAFAGNNPLRVANGRWHYTFPPATPVRVAKYEWDLFLKLQATPKGELLFEVAPAAAPSTPPSPAPSPAPTAAPTPTPEPEAKSAPAAAVTQETK